MACFISAMIREDRMKGVQTQNSAASAIDEYSLHHQHVRDVVFAFEGESLDPFSTDIASFCNL